MAEPIFNGDYIDRYLRCELSEDDEESFELALLDSPDLQAEVQAAMALREALRQDREIDTPERTRNWQPIALAASVLLAVFSTGMYLKTSKDAWDLQEQLNQIQQPRPEVVTFSLDIMRSAGSGPDLVIQKPAAGTVVSMDIELSAKSLGLSPIQAILRDQSGLETLGWIVEVRGQESISVAARSEQFPDGLVWLEMSAIDGEVFDRRSLEFLPSPGM